MFFTILITKFAAWLLGLFGRGSSLPGKIALKLSPNILGKLRLPPLIVAVTGSNGKTSTTELIFELAKKTGKRAICNCEGSNQIEGVATLFLKHATLFGKVKADIAVVESDERFCQHTFRFFTPQYIVVTNLFRDQMTRNGHSEFVYNELKKGLPELSTLILNADDPLSASYGFGSDDAVYFGIDPVVFVEAAGTEHAYDDGAFCPICGGRMEYAYRIANHLGFYACKSCAFCHPEPKHSVTGIADRKFTVDSLYEIRPQMLNTMFADNIVAAFTAGVEAFGLPEEEIAETLDGYAMKNDRIRKFQMNGHKGIFMLSKHENSMSYNGVLNSIVKSRSREKTVVIIFDLLSRKYVANDISWLWDVDFELLKNNRVKKIVLSGAFAYDLATRLDFAGIDMDIVTVEPDIRAMMERLRADAIGEIFVQTCFTDVGKFTSRLREGEA